MISKARYLVLATAILALSLAGCSSHAKSATLTLHLLKPHIQSLPVAESVQSMGDLLAFVGFVQRVGKAVGTLSGSQVTVDMPGNAIAEMKRPPSFESRPRTGTIN